MGRVLYLVYRNGTHKCTLLLLLLLWGQSEHGQYFHTWGRHVWVQSSLCWQLWPCAAHVSSTSHTDTEPSTVRPRRGRAEVQTHELLMPGPAPFPLGHTWRRNAATDRKRAVLRATATAEGINDLFSDNLFLPGQFTDNRFLMASSQTNDLFSAKSQAIHRSFKECFFFLQIT